MKRHFQIMTLALAAILTACTSQEPAAPAVAADETQSDAPTHSSIRTVDEAAAVARHSLSMLPQSDSRSGITRSFDKNAVKVATRQSQSRSGETDTLMYVFNFEDNQGFSVIAADSRVKPLIAVTEMGSYDPDSIPDNPGLAMYMDAAETLLYSVATTGDDGGNGNPGDHPELWLKPQTPYDPWTGPGGSGGGNSGQPQTKTVCDTTWAQWSHPNYDLRWGQSYPEGMLCPNGTSGCVNTASLIAMAYLETPTKVTLNFYGATYPPEIEIDWTAIKRHKESYNYAVQMQDDGCGYTPYNLHEAMAQICRELGLRNKTVYGYDFKDENDVSGTPASSTIIANAVPVLRGLGINVTEPAFWNTFDPYLPILNKNIVIAFGQGVKIVNNEEKEYAHAWIVDGFNYWNVKKQIYVYQDSRWVLNQENMIEFRYNHVNWGWNGNGNGYFASFTWDPKNPYFYDDPEKPSNNGGYDRNIGYILLSK